MERIEIEMIPGWIAVGKHNYFSAALRHIQRRYHFQSTWRLQVERANRVSTLNTGCGSVAQDDTNEMLNAQINQLHVSKNEDTHCPKTVHLDLMCVAVQRLSATCTTLTIH